MAMSKSDQIHDLRGKGMGEREAVLVSMKKTAAEKKEEKMDMAPATASPREEYSYGLRLDLNEEVLDKLGLDELPDVGDTLALDVKGTVESVSQRTDASDKTKHRSLTLQITDMSLE